MKLDFDSLDTQLGALEAALVEGATEVRSLFFHVSAQ
jgi:hypothetical protein